MVDVLISATARKYGVDKKDVFGPKEIGQELLKEVMDSSFISAKTKEQYCERLTVLQRGGATNEDDSVHSSQAVLSGSIEKFRARSITVTSLMMGILASTMTLVTTFVNKGRDNNPLFGSNVFEILLPTAAAVFVMLMLFFVMYVQRDLINKRKELTKVANGMNARIISDKDDSV